MRKDILGRSSQTFLITGRVAQAVWLLFVLFALSLALSGLEHYHDILQTACAGSDCLTGQLTPAEAQVAVVSQGSLSEYVSIVFIVCLFTDALLLLTAASLIWRKPTHPAAVSGAFLLAAAATGTLAQAAARSTEALLQPAQLIQFIQLATLLPFFALIPDGHYRPGWLRWAALAIVPAAALVAFGLAGPGLRIAIGVVTGAFMAGSVLYRWLADAQQQEQVAWAVAAVALLAGAQWIGRPIQLLPLLPMPLEHLPSQIFTFFPVIGMLLVVGALTCLVVSLLGDELFRVDVALNRAIVYSFLTLFVVGGYVLVVGYLSLIFQSSGSLWFSLIATGVVAALFHPLRERLQRFVNRMIYGERDDPYTVLSQLGQRLETAMASDEVIPTILQTVRGALKVSYAAIALKQPGGEGYCTVAEHGSPTNLLLDLPLVYQDEIVGQLQLGSRVEGDRFSPADQRLLNDLARQAGAAIHAARQNADLQIARQRLVTAREEERRRMRRDLHDGLGASLAALNLQAGELGRLIHSDPVEAARQVEELREEIRVAITDIRRLVYGLRPPALDELGLVEALRARAAQMSGFSTPYSNEQQTITHRLLQIKVESPGDLSPLPAAVEAAAYRIAMEALTNTIQHANAERCTIRLEKCKGGLSVEIYDDGVGLPKEYRYGIGLISMRERCAELGGTLSIDSAAGQGTRVSAWLPLAGGRLEGRDVAE